MVDAQNKAAHGRQWAVASSGGPQQYYKIVRRRVASCQQCFDIVTDCCPRAAFFCTYTIMKKIVKL
jgi:hypothetical protein